MMRVLRGHRVIGRRAGNPDWRERRRRANRIARAAPQYRQDGRWAAIPEDRPPFRRFTITPESVWSQPGGYSDDQVCAVRAERNDSEAA